MTRTTRHLEIVHPMEELPTELGGEAFRETAQSESPTSNVAQPVAAAVATARSPRRRTVEFQAGSVMELLAETVPPNLWREVLVEALERVDEKQAAAETSTH